MRVVYQLPRQPRSQYTLQAPDVPVIGAMAEFERSLILERVKAGLRNARAKGKRLGRPKKVVDAVTVSRLRAHGATWRAVAKQLGVGVGTLYRSVPSRSKSRERDFGTR